MRDKQQTSFPPCKRDSCCSSRRNSAISASRDANIFCCCSCNSAISSSWITSVKACCKVRPINVSRIGWTSTSKSNNSPSTISVAASTPTFAETYGGVVGRWRKRSVWHACSNSGGREKSWKNSSRLAKVLKSCATFSPLRDISLSVSFHVFGHELAVESQWFHAGYVSLDVCEVVDDASLLLLFWRNRLRSNQ